MQIDFDYFGIYFQNVLHKMYLEICTVTFRLLPIVIAVGYKNHLNIQVSFHQACDLISCKEKITRKHLIIRIQYCRSKTRHRSL